MKLIYCTHSICNPGGMERVLCNKVSWLVSHTGWEVLIVTTDQKGRPPFYPFPEPVRRIDMGINYSDDNLRTPPGKIAGYLAKRRKHRKALTEILMREKADIVVSLYPSESSFIPDIRDGSRKVLELHYCRYFRLQYGRKGILGLADRFRTWQDGRIVRKFDRFVVLTQEDRGYWGNLPNIEVIPNAALLPPKEGRYVSDVSAHRVIAVGRLDYQKGFDRLIDAWRIVKSDPASGDWTLDIFGQGEWKGMLQGMTDRYGLGGSVSIHAPVKDIWQEYAGSAFLVMSSHYEGFPMVMIEAMSCGLPVATFGYKCGPEDIIGGKGSGIIVREGDTEALAGAMKRLMSDVSLRRSMSREALKVTETYSEAAVMEKWMRLFRSLAAQPAGLMKADGTDKTE